MKFSLILSRLSLLFVCKLLLHMKCFYDGVSHAAHVNDLLTYLHTYSQSLADMQPAICLVLLSAELYILLFLFAAMFLPHVKDSAGLDPCRLLEMRTPATRVAT